MTGLLDAAAVAERYGLREVKSARRLMREVPGTFDLGRGRLRVSLDDLETWERSRRVRTISESSAQLPLRRRRANVPPGARPGFVPLESGWWKLPNAPGSADR